jgi:hypothetical protein
MVLKKRVKYDSSELLFDIYRLASPLSFIMYVGFGAWKI